MNDEQRKAFEEWADDKYVLHKDHDGDYMYTGAKCAFEAWQVAQQVKSLEFVQSPSGIKHTHTPFGTYLLCAHIDEVRMSLPEEINFYGRGYQTEAEAIEAAQQDYQRRALGCLVHGGV